MSHFAAPPVPVLRSPSRAEEVEQKPLQGLNTFTPLQGVHTTQAMKWNLSPGVVPCTGKCQGEPREEQGQCWCWGHCSLAQAGTLSVPGLIPTLTSTMVCDGWAHWEQHFL